jgi:hypothetical protein
VSCMRSVKALILQSVETALRLDRTKEGPASRSRLFAQSIPARCGSTTPKSLKLFCFLDQRGPILTLPARRLR